MRQDRIEDLPIALVRIESQIQEIPKEASALRRPECEGVLGGRNGIRGVLHPRGSVPKCGESEPSNRSVGCRVGQFVSAAWHEAAVQRDNIAVETPPVSGDADCRTVAALSHAQGIFRGHGIHRRVSRKIAHGQIRILCVGNERRSHDAARARSNWNADTHGAWTRHDIELPPDPDDGKALSQQEAVTVRALGRRIGGAGGAIEASQDDFVPTVHDIDQRDAVTAAWLTGSENLEVGREFDAAGRIFRGPVQIDDDAIARVSWIHGKVQATNDVLVRAARSERATAEHVTPCCDLDACHLGGGQRRRKHRRDHKQTDHDGAIALHPITSPDFSG